MAVHSRKRIFWVSAQTKEATFGTAITTNLSKLILDTGGFVDPQFSPFDDLDKLTGRIERTRQGLYNAAGPWAMSLSAVRVEPHLLAFVLAYGMGVHATDDDFDSLTGTTQNAASPSDSLVLDTFTLVEQVSSSVWVQYTGCMITDFSLTVSRGTNQLMDLTFNVLAAYRTELSAAPTSGNVLTITGERPFSAGKGGFWLGPRLSSASARLKGLTAADGHVAITNDPDAGTVDGFTADYGDLDINIDTAATNDYTKRMRTLTWNFSNEVDAEELMLFGDGDTLGKAERNGIVQSLECEFDYEDESELEDYMAQHNDSATSADALMCEYRAQTGRILTAAVADTTRAGREGVVLSFPKIEYAGLTRGEANNRLTLNATYNIISPVGNSKSMEAKVYSAYEDGFAN